MTYLEIFEELKQGKRIKLPAWGDKYLVLKDGQLIDNHGRPANMQNSPTDYIVVIPPKVEHLYAYLFRQTEREEYYLKYRTDIEQLKIDMAKFKKLYKRLSQLDCKA